MKSVAARRLLLACLASAGLLVCGLVGWRLHSQGYEAGEAVDWALAQVRGLGPLAFFTLMTFLPTVGAPLTVFTLTAGSVFAPTLGLPGVVLCAVLSIGLNLVLTYVLACWLVRPWIERLCAWLGYRIPEVPLGSQRSLVILMRVTPGPPYVLQNYLFGIARLQFATYFTTSWILVSLDSCIYILFGDALAHGKGRMVLISIGLFVALTMGVRFMRQRLQRKRPGVVT